MSPLERTLVEAITRGMAIHAHVKARTRVPPSSLRARVAAALAILPAPTELLLPDELAVRVRDARRVLRGEPPPPF